MSPSVVRTTLSVVSFASAAWCFVSGLVGLFSPWLVALVASLALLTVGFFLAERTEGKQSG